MDRQQRYIPTRVYSMVVASYIEEIWLYLTEDLAGPKSDDAPSCFPFLPNSSFLATATKKKKKNFF